MEQWILVIGKNEKRFNEIQICCQDCNVLFFRVESMTDAIRELMQSNRYLLVVAFSENSGILESLRSIRRVTKAPILVVKNRYDGNEKIAVIEAGADEYIQWSETVEESIASGYALIRRFVESNQHKDGFVDAVSYGDLVISRYYHKVFVGVRELEFPRREFDLLYLLASNPERVFTNEQLYRGIWGDDYLRDADNGLHSCLNRIRRKLEEAGCTSCRIENIRGVGYRFVQDDT